MFQAKLNNNMFELYIKYNPTLKNLNNIIVLKASFNLFE